VLDHDTVTLCYTNAGHNPPFLLRDGKPVRLTTGGLVLGADEDETYEQEEVTLKSGDIVVLYTDGVSEALGAGGEMFGTDRLLDTIREAVDARAQEIVGAIMTAINNFTQGKPQRDDITHVVLRVQ